MDEDRNERIVLCEACDSEGRIYWRTGACDNYGNEMLAEEPCPWCEGTGGEIIQTQSVEMEDLDHP